MSPQVLTVTGKTLPQVPINISPGRGKLIPPPKAAFFGKCISFLSRKQQEKETTKVLLVPHFGFVAINLQNYRTHSLAINLKNYRTHY